MDKHAKRVSLSKAAKLLEYRKSLVPPFDFEAVFSDETEEYVRDGNNGETTVALRVHAGQECSVFLCAVSGECILMQKFTSNASFDFYAASLKSGEKTEYYFKILLPRGECYYYNKRGVCAAPEEGMNFRLIPGFKAPGWAKGAVTYQIYVDRFYNGDKSNDVVNNEYAYLGRAAKRMESWSDPVQSDDICNFYGGDLAGIMQKIPYLKELGVEAVYLNPVFVSPSNHKYDIQDYEHIDPHIGIIANDGGEQLFFERFRNEFATKYMLRTTNAENLEKSDALFADIIKKLHENGIRVILDGVFNHCGAFNKWLDREGFYARGGYPPGAFADRQSPYAGYFKWNGDVWPGNEYYDCWWGHLNHPKLYYEGSQELYEYMMHIAAKWVSAPFNADGWRLDVAADLGYSKEFNHKFWKDFRSAVKAANPDAIIIAEHYGDPSDWLSGGEWDTVMNYDAFMEPLTWFFCGMEKHSQEFNPEMLNNAAAFKEAMRRGMALLPAEALHTAMNQLSNHDHSRFLTRTNMRPGRLHTLGAKEAEKGVNKSVMYSAVVMQMTWPGSPCVYYGDEAGLCGWTDPDNRRPFPWGSEDKDMLAFHRNIIAMRKKSPALRRGSLEFLHVDFGVLCYARILGNEKIIVVINNNSIEKKIGVPVWKLDGGINGRFVKLLETKRGCFDMCRETIAADGSILTLDAPPLSATVLALE